MLSNVVVFKLTDGRTWLFADRMEEHGWKLDKLILNNEKYLGLTVTPITSTTPMKDEFIKAV